eukprot:Hpha_TRINITY_DN15990_c0_g6::TRINITY_DN15990_c0_g6_i1::g.74359::m.74359/K00387/SUOX; sulfite oxidase
MQRLQVLAGQLEHAAVERSSAPAKAENSTRMLTKLPAGPLAARSSEKQAPAAPQLPATQHTEAQAVRQAQREDDAERKESLRQLTHRPYNAETPNAILKTNFFTPQKDFYVRSHLPMPKIDVTVFQMKVHGAGVQKTLSMEDIKKLPATSRPIVVQCGGNRRDEMNQLKETRGLKWKQGCIGNAVWDGVLLSDVLKAAGLQAPSEAAKHVVFESADGYSVSIPTEMAFSRDCVMAWGMNGEVLSRAHGYPLRVVVPGVIGARSAKYVTGLRLSHEEAQTPWQRADYKLLPPNVDFRQMMKVFKDTPPIMDMPVQSCMLTPEDGDTVPTGATSVKAIGYAYSGGGRPIRRVDVSGDGGLSWQQAELHGAENGPAAVHKDPQGQDWSWTFWSADIPLGDMSEGGVHTITCKAVNTANDTQPETARGIWNVRGLCNNSWQQVRLHVQGHDLTAPLSSVAPKRGAALGESGM